MSDIPDFSKTARMRNLLTRVVKYAGTNSAMSAPKWSHVKSLFGHGKGYSIAICKEFGVDPNELVGGLKVGKYCSICELYQICSDQEEFTCMCYDE